jgi:hypothetical protein
MNINQIKHKLLTVKIPNFEYIIEVGNSDPNEVQRFLLDNGIQWNNLEKWDDTPNITYFLLFKHYNSNKDIRMILITSKKLVVENENFEIVCYNELDDNYYNKFIYNLFEDIL